MEGAIEDPDLEADLAGTLAELLLDLGELEDARDLMEQAVRAAEQAYTSPHPKILKRQQNLAVLLFGDNKMAEAEEVFLSILAQRTQLNQGETQLFRTRNNLASAIMRQGRLGEAEAIFLDILEGRKKLYQDRFGPHDEDIATSRHSLAVFYLEAGDLEQA